MDTLTSTLNNFRLDPELAVGSFVKALTVLATAASYYNITWPASSRVKDGDHFDFIIVGAGTAGSVLARRLTEVRDWRVLVVEYGSDPTKLSLIPGLWQLLPHGSLDWDYVSEVDGRTSQGLNGKRTLHTSGKVLGGSTTIDHLLLQRGTKFDYDEWSENGHKGWDWESALKYFKKSEKMLDSKILNGNTSEFHCSNGAFDVKPQTVNKVFEKKNQQLLKSYEYIGMKTIDDPLGPVPDGTSKSYLSVQYGNNRRSTTAEAYLLPSKGRRNFYLLKEALATKIIIDEQKTAKGVKIRTKFGDINVFADVEVILSAGVYNSPQLLMLSGIGPKEDLEKLNIPVIQDLPVGTNMQDHVLAPVVITGQSNLLTVLDAGLSLTELGTFPVPFVSGAFSSSMGKLDMQHLSVVFGTLSPFLFLLLFVNYNFNLQVSKSLFLSNPEKERMLAFVGLVKPKSRGRVTLRSNNPKDPPVIYNNYYTEEDDVKRMVESVKRIVSLQNTPYVTQSGGKFIRPILPECDGLVYGSDDYWVCYVKTLASTLYHTTSTCSMGVVVDDRLNVKGVKKLRVVDASVMPTIPASATLLPTLMVAEKAADIIKEDYGKTEGFQVFPCCS